MKSENSTSAAREAEQRQRRETERYLDRPSLTMMLFILAAFCLVFGALIDKDAISRSSAGSAWSAGLAIGAGLAAVVVCASGVWFRAVLESSQRRRMQYQPALPGSPRANVDGWRFTVPFFVLLVALSAGMGAAGYMLYWHNLAARHPHSLFQMILLGYATALFACFVGLIAWLTAWPYYGLGMRRLRLALRGHCPGPVRIHERPAGLHNGRETGSCYLPVCDCMWTGRPQPTDHPGAEASAMAEALRHSPNAQMAAE
jgi:hypothetical protein